MTVGLRAAALAAGRRQGRQEGWSEAVQLVIALLRQPPQDPDGTDDMMVQTIAATVPGAYTREDGLRALRRLASVVERYLAANTPQQRST
jgi:hypothetical protein